MFITRNDLDKLINREVEKEISEHDYKRYVEKRFDNLDECIEEFKKYVDDKFRQMGDLK